MVKSTTLMGIIKLSGVTVDIDFVGIPLASATVIKLAGIDQERFGEVSYSFNRKEKKEYGDGGSLVGGEFSKVVAQCTNDIRKPQRP